MELNSDRNEELVLLEMKNLVLMPCKNKLNSDRNQTQFG